MRIINHQEIRVIALRREEAVRLVHDLVNQLANAPGAGSIDYVLRNEDGQGDARVAFLLDSKP